MANIQNIELRKLRHVIEVGTAGSISVAAGTLGISQPALSRSIALLEHQIGIQLFERGNFQMHTEERTAASTIAPERSGGVTRGIRERSVASSGCAKERLCAGNVSRAQEQL